MVQPSYSAGFVSPQRGGILRRQWANKVAAYSPLLGETGLLLPDHSQKSKAATLTNMPANGAQWDRQNGYPCLKFVGGSSPSSHVACGNAPIDLSVYTQPFTISAWIKINAWRSGAGTEGFNILTIGTGDYNAIAFVIYPKKITLIGDTNGLVDWNLGITTTIGTTVLSLATLYHVAITRSNTGVYTAWLNGKADGTVTLASNLTLNNQTMRLGSHYALNTTYDSDGWIFDFQFDSRDFTSNEMLEAARRPGIIYERQPRRVYATVATVLDTGSGSASFNFTSAAGGASDATGSGSSSFNFTAASVGRSDATGSGAASFSLTASAGGASDVTGSGSSTFNFTAAATGASEAVGSGSAAFNFTAEGEPLLEGTGTGSASFSFTAAAGGLSDATGLGSASVRFDAAGAGISDFSGSGSATFSIAASASGLSDVVSSGSAVFSFVATGDPLLPFSFGTPRCGWVFEAAETVWTFGDC